MKSNLIWCDKCKDATSHWEGKCLICEHESKDQPQDTTLVPIEEDSELKEIQFCLSKITSIEMESDWEFLDRAKAATERLFKNRKPKP